jgi:E3 ubiquitin-protein ligase RNF5
VWPPLLVQSNSRSWQCIYHWLRSNQEYLTCPLCKSGLELSSVRPILLKNEPPEKEEFGIPPRPRPFRKVKNKKDMREIPKSILSMGMNVQRGVLLAGYGIFPSVYQCLLQNFKAPELHEDAINDKNL